MWSKRDWQEFYVRLSRNWQRLRPPRPVSPAGGNRVVPAAGFSLGELEDAGISVERAEQLGLPVEAGRAISYGPNVTMLRDFLRATRLDR